MSPFPSRFLARSTVSTLSSRHFAVSPSPLHHLHPKHASAHPTTTKHNLRTASTRTMPSDAANGTAAITQRAAEQAAAHLTPSSVPKTAWSTPGPAAFDFRSDVVTTPTASMLAAIAGTTLLDDVFVEDPTTIALESLIAALAGHPAALLVLSGTMGNQVALRALLTAPPHGVLCDHRAHILEWEAGGVASLCGALVRGVVPKNGHHLTLEDVVGSAVVSDDVHACPTRVISLENTLGGTVLPLEECRRISAWARERGILMHLDGARLWEAVAAGAGPLEEYCACFDSVSLCFSKGLGAPIGSVIVGGKAFIKRARWIRKSIGGGVRQAGVVTAAARVAVEETYLGGKLKASHDSARRVAKIWEGLGGKCTLPVETNMVWLDIEAAGLKKDDFIKLAESKGLRTLGGRLVVHYQISDEAIDRLEGLMKEILREGKKSVPNGEVNIPPEDLKINVE